MSGFSTGLHRFLISLLFIRITTFLTHSKLKVERFSRKFLIGSISSNWLKIPILFKFDAFHKKGFGK